MKAYKLDYPGDGRGFLREDIRCHSPEQSWHWHRSWELMLIQSGHGRVMIGDYIGRYEPLQAYLIGPGLPHSFDGIDAERSSDHQAFSLTIHPPDADVQEQAEWLELRSLLEEAAYGLRFPQFLTRACLEYVQGMERSGMAGYLQCLHMLLLCARAESSAEKMSHLPGKSFTFKDRDRMGNLYEYVFSHYQEPITIPDVAAALHMSVSRLHAFVKECTKRTVTDFINDVRISNACRLLIETDRSITDIAYGVGFGTLAHFNRRFKRARGMTPRAYRSRTG